MNTIRKILYAAGHSLTTRLLVIFFLSSLAYGYVARFAYTVFLDTDYLRQIVGSHIALHSEYILNDIGSPPDIERAKAIVQKVPVDVRIVGPDVDWSSSPDFYPLEKISFGPLSLLDLGDAGLAEVQSWAKKLQSVQFARYKEHVLIKLDDNGYQIVFASPRISEQPKPDYSTLIIGIAGILVLLYTYFAVRWVFRPVSWMQEGAARIGRGELDYRIPTPRHDELGDLSREFNKMANDVQEMLEAKRQLMLAISHELRSPLTRSKVSVEFIDDEHVRNNILEDIKEMEDLITDLLESEALNTRHAALRREPVQMQELVNAVVEGDFGGRPESIRVQCGSDLPIADLDATRVRLLLRNLIDNALRYNPADGPPVTVQLSCIDDVLVIEVSDHGPGIPAEHIDRVMEPFYRADPARSRATGGFGLGLSLCNRIVIAHGGELQLVNNPGQGTSAIVRLPVQ